MTTSTVPEVIDALVAVCKGMFPPTTQVIDGAPINNLQAEWVAIGYSSLNGDAVTNVQTIGDAALRSGRESYDITSEINAWNGSTDTSTLRARVFELLDIVEAALVADKTLGFPKVQLATLVATSYVTTQTDKGVVVTLPFVIHIDAWR